MRESVVTCQLVGRLGNQLWQIAATINYGLKHNLTIRFPKRTLNEQFWPMMFKGLPTSNDNPRTWEQPMDGGYYEIPYYPNGIKLRGFFQSYKYIDRPKTLGKLKDYIGYQDQEVKKGVAVHIRRGDYVDLKNTFPCLPIKYYHLAMIELQRNDITVFSDDITWCKQNFNYGFNFHETSDPVSDLFEMSRFEHQVIANSSYSYWAATLNPNPDKIIICPHHEQYYGPGNAHLKTVDLYPPEWKEVRF